MADNFHGTACEIEFIKNIGSWGDVCFNRVDQLKQYISSSLKRTEWGRIDRKRVLDFAYSELEKELKYK